VTSSHPQDPASLGLEALSGRTDRLWAKGEFRDFPVFRAAVASLHLNPTNRRFRAERQEMQTQLGRDLDPLSNPADERSIVSLLLDQNHYVEADEVKGTQRTDAKALRRDWERRKQERPLWIRPSGFVSNGNRRLAMLKRLAADVGHDGYDFVDVIVLPWEQFTDADLFEMEAREQLTEGLKVRYSDLNALLTLKDAAEMAGIDWDDERSIEQVGNDIQHLVRNSANYARRQLRAVKYMTDFLAYVGLPGEYHRLNRRVERFRDVGNNMAWVMRNDVDHAPDMLELMFAALQSDVPHEDLREMRKILLSDPERFDSVVGEVRDIEDEEIEEEPDLDDPTAQPEASALGLEDDEEDDDEDAYDEPGTGVPTVAGYPKKTVGRALSQAVKAAEARRDPDLHGHVRSAALALELVDPELLPQLLTQPQAHKLQEALEAIAIWTEAASRAVAGPNA
jgi:hypothetical protein